MRAGRLSVCWTLLDQLVLHVAKPNTRKGRLLCSARLCPSQPEGERRCREDDRRTVPHVQCEAFSQRSTPSSKTVAFGTIPARLSARVVAQEAQQPEETLHCMGTPYHHKAMGTAGMDGAGIPIPSSTMNFDMVRPSPFYGFLNHSPRD